MHQIWRFAVSLNSTLAKCKDVDLLVARTHQYLATPVSQDQSFRYIAIAKLVNVCGVDSDSGTPRSSFPK